MLIADINHHEAILSKLWMNKNEILLNMHHDTIIFSDQLNTSISIFPVFLITKHSSWSQSTLISSVTYKVLKRSASIILKEFFSIQNIDVAFFQMLMNQSKWNHIKVFAMFIKDIDREIVYNTQCNLDVLNMFFTDETAQNLKDIKVKLSSKYQKFLDVFDQA